MQVPIWGPTAPGAGKASGGSRGALGPLQTEGPLLPVHSLAQVLQSRHSLELALQTSVPRPGLLYHNDLRTRRAQLLKMFFPT